QQIGQGTLTFPDGRKIMGAFKDHRPHGAAIESGPTATFDGLWVDGVLNGKAVATFADGSKFEGVFVNGKRNGIGIDTYADGTRQQCNYVNDVRQGNCNKVTGDGKSIEYRSNRNNRRN